METILQASANCSCILGFYTRMLVLTQPWTISQEFSFLSLGVAALFSSRAPATGKPMHVFCLSLVAPVFTEVSDQLMLTPDLWIQEKL